MADLKIVSFIILLTLSLLMWTTLSTVDVDPEEEEEEEERCPNTWFTHPPNASSAANCSCGSGVGGRVRCNDDTKQVSILLAYCMTYDNVSGETVLGSCPFFPITNYSNGFVSLPNKVEKLNHFVCGEHHRRGRLCGECQKGYGPGPLSYDHQCTKCDILNSAVRWSVFLFQQFLPVTVFFFIVLAFRLEVISGPRTAFVFFAQVYSSPEIVRLIEVLGRQAAHINTDVFLSYQKYLISAYGVWNLDFFRPFLADICLEETLTTVEAVGLEYLVPLYVILLTIITFAMLELHGHGFKPIVWLWKPFVVCFSKWNRHWSIRDSFIHTIATFLLLSYTKLLVVSIRILNGAIVYDINGKKVGLVPYLSPTQDYFIGDHGIFATLAILALIVVMIPPVVLLLYPLRVFHACMDRCCRARLQNGLRTFVESFQGNLKDGVGGGYDCRYVAGWYFLLRIIVAIGGIDNPFSLHFGRQAIGLILFLTAVTFALVQPYKRKFLNVVDTLHFVVLSLIYWLILNAVYLTLLEKANYILGVICLLTILPLLYRCGLFTYWVCFEKRLLPVMYYKLKTRCGRKASSINELNPRTPLVNPASNEVEASFADRLANPDVYDALIPSRQKVLHRRSQMLSTGTEYEPIEDVGTSIRLGMWGEREGEGEGKGEGGTRDKPTNSVVDMEGERRDSVRV